MYPHRWFIESTQFAFLGKKKIYLLYFFVCVSNRHSCAAGKTSWIYSFVRYISPTPSRFHTRGLRFSVSISAEIPLLDLSYFLILSFSRVATPFFFFMLSYKYRYPLSTPEIYVCVRTKR